MVAFNDAEKLGEATIVKRVGKVAGKAKHRVSRADWIKAGLRTLAAKGIDAVRVEQMAKALGVTKGSFYWHFADRAELHQAILDHWQVAATQGIIDTVEAAGGGPEERLDRLFKATATSKVGAALDVAIHGWAMADPGVSAVVAKVDEQRIAYVAKLLRAIGLPAGKAALRARIIYLVLRGCFHAMRKNTVSHSRWTRSGRKSGAGRSAMRD